MTQQEKQQQLADIRKRFMHATAVLMDLQDEIGFTKDNHPAETQAAMHEIVTRMDEAEASLMEAREILDRLTNN
jgi:flagellar hook-basal body complex protein FliE